MKIHPISSGLAKYTNLSTTGTFEGCSLHDIVRELSVKMSMGELSFFHTKTIEIDVNQAL